MTVQDNILKLKLEREKFKLAVLKCKYIRVSVLKKAILEVRDQEKTGKTRQEIMNELLKIIK